MNQCNVLSSDVKGRCVQKYLTTEWVQFDVHNIFLHLRCKLVVLYTRLTCRWNSRDICMDWPSFSLTTSLLLQLLLHISQAG